MLFKKLDEISGKVLKVSKPLLFSAAQAYVPPKKDGSEWFLTTTTIWPTDELIGRRIRDWRRLLGETGHTGERTQTMRSDHNSIYTGTHSVFPAPLCEWILLRYGPPAGGLILDAFAGGPPRAIVAAFMGYRYLGYEIRKEQIDENLKIIRKLGIESSIDYRCSDGTSLDGCPDSSCDFSLTCSPYYNLEQYSDLPNDLSNMPDYQTFNQAMFECAKAHFRALKPGAFACFVTCPFRIKAVDGINELIDFPGDTVLNLKEAGFRLWQKIVLSRNFASAACRSTTSWKGQKLVPRHEELLIFKKPEEAKRKRLKLD